MGRHYLLPAGRAVGALWTTGGIVTDRAGQDMRRFERSKAVRRGFACEMREADALVALPGHAHAEELSCRSQP